MKATVLLKNVYVIELRTKRSSSLLWINVIRECYGWGRLFKRSSLVDFNLEKKLFFFLDFAPVTFLFNRGFSVWNNELLVFLWLFVKLSINRVADGCCTRCWWCGCGSKLYLNRDIHQVKVVCASCLLFFVRLLDCSKEIFGLSFRIFIRPSKGLHATAKRYSVVPQEVWRNEFAVGPTRNLSLMRKLTLLDPDFWCYVREILFFDL